MKTYSEKFLNNSDILKKARIGFEFEFYMKDLSYYKTLELINQYLSPIKVWGFKQYHSDFTPDNKTSKLSRIYQVALTWSNLLQDLWNITRPNITL